jgi:hypothetical protein
MLELHQWLLIVTDIFITVEFVQAKDYWCIESSATYTRMQAWPLYKQYPAWDQHMHVIWLYWQKHFYT